MNAKVHSLKSRELKSIQSHLFLKITIKACKIVKVCFSCSILGELELDLKIRQSGKLIMESQ